MTTDTEKVIISVTGRDRPGILAAVSRVLLERGCNLENVSQTILQSVFGALFLVSKPKGLDNAALQAAIEAGIGDFALDVHVARFDAGAAVEPFPAEAFIITATGPDGKGLVHAITSVLAEHGINVTNLQAVFRGGDEPGSNSMIFQVDVPASANLPALIADLEHSAGRAGLDINIQHRKIFESMSRI